MKKIQDLTYTRPDFDIAKQQMQSQVKALQNAVDVSAAKQAILAMEQLQTEIQTAYTLANIRYTGNTADPFYNEEMAFFNQAFPTLLPVEEAYAEAFLSTPHREALEKEFGTQIFALADIRKKIRNPIIMEELVEEAQTCDDYSKLVASCITSFQGEECNFYGLLKFMQDPDRAIRKEAFVAWANMYESVAPKLDALYDKLVALRVTIAEKLNFPSYIPVAYYNKRRMDYTAEDVAVFRKQVQEVIVPLCDRLRKEQAQRIGVDSLKYYDEEYLFTDGNPMPVGDMHQMLDWTQTMYQELSPETGTFFDFMMQYELFDLPTRKNKHLGGYCTSLRQYKAPFIFSNFNGTSDDVDVLTHEAGHAFASFVASREQPLSDMMSSTSEINEIHAMSMELFAHPWMHLFFGDSADKYRFGHLCKALFVIPYMVAVDEFQHKVFENPTMSAKQRSQTWRNLEKTYMPWRDYDGVPFLEEGGFWMQKQHIFLYPFYYIDYALAQVCSFEIYGKILENPAKAWQDYLTLCKAGGSLGYFDLLKLANLSNPFEEGTVEKAMKALTQTIDDMRY